MLALIKSSKTIVSRTGFKRHVRNEINNLMLLYRVLIGQNYMLHVSLNFIFFSIVEIQVITTDARLSVALLWGET